mgnify:CR=1 FL=1
MKATLGELILCGVTAAFLLASLMLALNFEFFSAASYFVGGTFGLLCIENMQL